LIASIVALRAWRALNEVTAPVEEAPAGSKPTIGAASPWQDQLGSAMNHPHAGSPSSLVCARQKSRRRMLTRPAHAPSALRQAEDRRHRLRHLILRL
jgi:hypothetical protein